MYQPILRHSNIPINRFLQFVLLYFSIDNWLLFLCVLCKLNFLAPIAQPARARYHRCPDFFLVFPPAINYFTSDDENGSAKGTAMVKRSIAMLTHLFFYTSVAISQPILYSVEYGDKPNKPPSLVPVYYAQYRGFERVFVVQDNWYYASRQRADSVNADAFIIPGGNTSDVPFYDGSLDSYVQLLKNPGRPAMGFCAGLQFLLMARGGICAPRSGERGNITATIHKWDEIFNGCPNPYTDRAAHSYSIAAMPGCFRNLATTRYCYITFVRHITMPLYGSQLHIESMNNPNSAGPAILANFRNIIMQRKFHGVAEVIDTPGTPGQVRMVWWRAKTGASVTYQIFYATQEQDLDYQTPQFETTDLHYEITGLDPTVTYYFAVRARSSAFIDSNKAVYPLQPDGHRQIIFQNGKAIDGQNYNACEATVISEAYPNSNYGRLGAAEGDRLYWWNSGLVQFQNLEKYLAGKKIIGGELTFLFAGGVTESTNQSHKAEISIYPILKPWHEGDGYTHTTAGTDEVTWNSAGHNVTKWEVAGCKGPSDRQVHPIDSYTIKGDGSGISFDGTVTLAAQLIQKWVDSPENNCGLLFEKSDTYPDNQYFYFLDDDDPWFMNTPRLIVQYLDESTTPVAEKESTSSPTSWTLGQNYPNPFNQSTVLPLELCKATHVRLEVYDVTGRIVARIFDGNLSQGRHQFVWNGQDMNRNQVSSGLYFCKLVSAEKQSIRRMIVVR